MGTSFGFIEARYRDLDAFSPSMADQVASAVDTKRQQCWSLDKHAGHNLYPSLLGRCAIAKSEMASFHLGCPGKIRGAKLMWAFLVSRSLRISFLSGDESSWAPIRWSKRSTIAIFFAPRTESTSCSYPFVMRSRENSKSLWSRYQTASKELNGMVCCTKIWPSESHSCVK